MSARKQVEELAKKRGVLLAAPAPVAPDAAGVQARAQGAPSGRPGFLAQHMPAAAALMLDMKAQLPAGMYRAALDGIKAGRGYVVDASAGLALGAPPDDWTRGTSAERNGYNVTRVKRKV